MSEILPGFSNERAFLFQNCVEIVVMADVNNFHIVWLFIN